MTDETDTKLAVARAEGRAMERRRFARVAAIFVATTVLFLVGMGVVVSRAQNAAPGVIGEIAAERRAAVESRFDARIAEATVLASDALAFLQLVWERNDAIGAIRNNLASASTEADLLQREVLAAIDSPSRNLGALYDNGPTRARAVLDHLVAAIEQLKTFLPALVAALASASDQLDAGEDGQLADTTLQAFLTATAPLVGDNVELKQARERLVSKFETWRASVSADLAFAREQMSGESIQTDFERRLLDHIF